jgi:hypothetical protein
MCACCLTVNSGKGSFCVAGCMGRVHCLTNYRTGEGKIMRWECSLIERAHILHALAAVEPRRSCGRNIARVVREGVRMRPALHTLIRANMCEREKETLGTAGCHIEYYPSFWCSGGGAEASESEWVSERERGGSFYHYWSTPEKRWYQNKRQKLQSSQQEWVTSLCAFGQEGLAILDTFCVIWIFLYLLQHTS